MDKIRYIKTNLSKPIVIIGMMGVGKTHIGRMLGSILDTEFIDADQEIERAANLTISEIFEKFGEEYFRDGERRVIKRLINRDDSVIATGGGAVLNTDTLKLIKDKALSIWLNADIEIILERILRNDRRPLMRVEDPKAKIEELLDFRLPLYKQADITILSNNSQTNEIKEEIIDKIYDFLIGNSK